MQDKIKFYSKISKPDKNGCMNWLGAKSSAGYGTVYFNKKPATLTHRHSYELHKGEIPPGMCVCHSCDNPACVNPEHLWLGTIAQNNEDMIRRGRQNLKVGVRLHAKLTEFQVKEIRNKIKNGLTMVALSKEYDVSDRTINDINSGKIWASIDTEKDKIERLDAVNKTRRRYASFSHAKLSIEDVIDIKKRLLLGDTQISIAKDYNVSKGCICTIKTERAWKEVLN